MVIVSLFGNINDIKGRGQTWKVISVREPLVRELIGSEASLGHEMQDLRRVES